MMNCYFKIVLFLCIAHLSCSQSSQQGQPLSIVINDLRAKNPMFNLEDSIDDDYYIFNHLQLNNDTLPDIIVSAVYKEEYQNERDSRAYFFLINQGNNRYVHTKTIRKVLAEGADGGQSTSYPQMVGKYLVFREAFFVDVHRTSETRRYSYFFLLDSTIDDWVLSKVIYEECKKWYYEDVKLRHRALRICQDCKVKKELKINKVIKIEDVNLFDYYDKM